MTEPVQITEVPDEVVQVIEETPLTVVIEEAEGQPIVIELPPEDSEVIISIPGPVGPPGPPGPEGPAGTLEGYTLSFLHTQTPASDTWTVNHNLGRIPMAVSIIDSAGNEVMAEIHHNSINQLVASFGSAFSGELRCG